MMRIAASLLVQKPNNGICDYIHSSIHFANHQIELNF